MYKLLLSVGCALALLASATVSDAVVNPRIYVKITDGTNTVDGLAVAVPPAAFAFAKVSAFPAGALDATDTLNVLTCQTRPCKVYFPGGQPVVVGQQPPSGATFKLEDVSSASLARVEKFDSGASADRVSLKGLKITSVVAGKVLTVTYGVESGALRVLPAPVPPATSTSYTGTAALTGTFKNSAGTGRALACNAGLTATDVGDSCVRLSLALNGTTVNGAGGTAVATVAVPCNNSPTGSPSPASVNPCGVNGIYTSSLGSFTGINDSNSINCPTSCSPTQVGTIVAKFNGTGEVLQLTASANGGMANVSDEAGGLEEVFLTLADELGANRWVAYTATSEKCKAVPKAPTVNDTRNINNNSMLPISFEFWCGFFAPPAPGAGIDLVSIVDPAAEGDLAGSAAKRNDASRVAFLPAQGQLQLKNITVLSLTYDVVTGSAPSGNNTLGNLIFAPCTAGSFRVEFELLNNQGAPVGTAKVYLGSNAGDQFKSDCSDFLTGRDLVNNADARVDTSGLDGNLGSPTPITFQQLKSGNTGKLLVRKMSVIVDQGDDPLAEPANHKVIFLGGTVNTFPAAPYLQVVTTPTRTFDLSTNGVSIVIKKLTDGNGNPVDEVVKVIRSADIQIIGGKFSAAVNVNDISPESGAQYTISLCPNGAEETLPLTDTTTPLGLCIPDQAFMTLL